MGKHQKKKKKDDRNRNGNQEPSKKRRRSKRQQQQILLVTVGMALGLVTLQMRASTVWFFHDEESQQRRRQGEFMNAAEPEVEMSSMPKLHPGSGGGGSMMIDIDDKTTDDDDTLRQRKKYKSSSANSDDVKSILRFASTSLLTLPKKTLPHLLFAANHAKDGGARPIHNRTWIQDLEDLRTKSREFSLIYIDDDPPPDVSMRYLPMTTFRDCNRARLAGTVPEVDQYEKWPPPVHNVLPFNLNRQLDRELQIEHCFRIAKLFQKIAAAKKKQVSALTPEKVQKYYFHVPDQDQLPLFVVRTNKVAIDEAGIVHTQRPHQITPHGKFGLLETGEMLNFQQLCMHQLGYRVWTRAVVNHTNCDTNLKSSAAVLVASQFWGWETGHFIGEVLPRIVTYLKPVQQMTRRRGQKLFVHLHFGPKNRITGQQRLWMDYLGVNPATRVVGGCVCAETVYVASPSDCRGGAYMKQMLLQTRRVIMSKYYYYDGDTIVDKEARNHGLEDMERLIEGSSRKMDDAPVSDKFLSLEYRKRKLKILIMQRTILDPRRETLSVHRLEQLRSTLQRSGYRNIHVLAGNSSASQEFWSCIECQLQTFSETWLLIASHGAGLMNLQWLREGSHVVELSSFARPEQPLYSNMEQRAHVLGLHFMHYHWSNRTQSPDRTGDLYRLNVTLLVHELQLFTSARASIPLPTPPAATAHDETPAVQ